MFLINEKLLKKLIFPASVLENFLRFCFSWFSQCLGKKSHLSKKNLGTRIMRRHRVEETDEEIEVRLILLKQIDLH